MPKTTVTHEAWCAEHLGTDEGLDETCCTKGVQFGPLMPKHPGDPEDEADTRGSLYVQLAENEVEPLAIVEWAPRGHGQITLGALGALCSALVEDPDELLRAINETLAQLESKASA